MLEGRITFKKSESTLKLLAKTLFEGHFNSTKIRNTLSKCESSFLKGESQIYKINFSLFDVGHEIPILESQNTTFDPPKIDKKI